MSLYVAAYDIRADSRRRRVADVLARYGLRIQDSIFELRLEPDDLVELRCRIGPLLAREDAFDLMPIDERGTRRRYSWMRQPQVWEPVLLL
ncbi:MAG: CRISPR-associated endonuclease Cas2 [Phycisphaerales bacterium]|nr:CRISPR-associated endonuclease Cas2 [Phycisphaerales bacterium]